MEVKKILVKLDKDVLETILDKNQTYYQCFDCDKIFKDIGYTIPVLDLSKLSEDDIKFVNDTYKISHAYCPMCYQKMAEDFLANYGDMI